MGRRVFAAATTSNTMFCELQGYSILSLPGEAGKHWGLTEPAACTVYMQGYAGILLLLLPDKHR